MSAVIERGAAAAREILEQRDPYGSELRDNTFCLLMLAEAWTRGFVAGLEQAGDVVQIELEGTRGQLSDDVAGDAGKGGAS